MALKANAKIFGQKNSKILEFQFKIDVYFKLIATYSEFSPPNSFYPL